MLFLHGGISSNDLAKKTNYNVWPLGYVTGSAMPEQKGAETDTLLEEGGNSEGDAAPENTKSLKTKVVPETVAGKSTESIIPEETLTVGVPEIAPKEANIRSQPEAGLGVKGLPTGQSGATGKLNLELSVCVLLVSCICKCLLTPVFVQSLLIMITLSVSRCVTQQDLCCFNG